MLCGGAARLPRALALGTGAAGNAAAHGPKPDPRGAAGRGVPGAPATCPGSGTRAVGSAVVAPDARDAGGLSGRGAGGCVGARQGAGPGHGPRARCDSAAEARGERRYCLLPTGGHERSRQSRLACPSPGVARGLCPWQPPLLPAPPAAGPRPIPCRAVLILLPARSRGSPRCCPRAPQPRAVGRLGPVAPQAALGPHLCPACLTPRPVTLGSSCSSPPAPSFPPPGNEGRGLSPSPQGLVQGDGGTPNRWAGDPEWQLLAPHCGPSRHEAELRCAETAPRGRGRAAWSRASSSHLPLG